MNVDLLSWSPLLFSWKSFLCTDKVWIKIDNLCRPCDHAFHRRIHPCHRSRYDRYWRTSCQGAAQALWKQDRRDLEEINCKLNVIGGTPTVLISVAVAASSAMVLPISTPPNALAFATNLISQKDMARIGLIIGIMSMVLGISMLYLLGTMHLI